MRIKPEKRISNLGLILLGVAITFGCLYAEESLDQPLAPELPPIDNLLPKFSKNATAISHSGQFKISGGNFGIRGTAANLAEEAKAELLTLIEEEDEWKVPIVIDMLGKQGDPVPLRNTVLDLRFSEKGYEVKIFVNLSRGLQRESFKRAVLSSLIYGRALFAMEKPDSTIPLSVSPWFVEGLLEATAWRLNQADRRLYDAIYQHGGLFKLEEIFTLSEGDFLTIDAASKAAFRVASGALVMALLEQPDGKVGMRELLADLPVYDAETPSLLRRIFPDLNLSQNSLEKWLTLQLASKGSAPLTEVIGVIKTERLLAASLRLRYRDKELDMIQEIPFSDWATIHELDKAEKLEAVRLAQDDLVRLSYRCFTSYRPLLREYQLLLTAWVEGKTQDLSSNLERLMETRQNMVTKSENARDFLDWFEITRARETSGAFDDYLNLKSRLKLQSHKRKDPISKYLDRLDPLFALPEQR